MILSPHLSARALVRMIDDDGAPVDARTRTHLAQCSACRTCVQELRTLAVTAKALPAPAPTSELLSRIHARLEAGERVILPVTSREPRTVRSLRAISLAVGASVLVGLAALWATRSPREVQAGWVVGSLELSPARPRRGDSVHARYRAPAMLSDARELMLRARYRSPSDEPYNFNKGQRLAAVLHRAGDGTFQGAFVLPDSVVFAALAVEDAVARYVDDHGGRPWEVLVHDDRGRPTSQALLQREHDYYGRDMAEVLATARQRAALDPDDPGTWTAVYAHESFLIGRSTARALEHRRRLAALDARWSADANPPTAIIAGMLAYAAQLSDGSDSLTEAIRARWRSLRDRAARADSASRLAVDTRWWRLNDMAMRDPDSARIALALAEQFWAGIGRTSPHGTLVGVQIARLAGDSTEARLRWTDRRAAAEPQADALYGELARIPALRRVAIERLTALVARLETPDDSRRALGSTAVEARVDDASRARRVLAMIGTGLLASGETARAHDALVRATSEGWDPALYRRTVPALLAAGDTARAVALAARLAIDADTSAFTGDSTVARLRLLVDASRWRALVAESRARLREHLLATAIDVALPSPVALVDSASRSTTLAEMTRGRIAVVAFVARRCGPGCLPLEQLWMLRQQLEARGMTLVTIVDEPPSPSFAAFLARSAPHVRIHFDVSASARRAFNSWALPEYFVLDASGAVRFRRSATELVLAQAEALRGQ